MPYDVKFFVGPYGEDNALNIFGDYDQLALCCLRDQKTQQIYKEWRLQSCNNIAVHKVLTPDQVYGILENSFIQTAEKVDRSPVDSWPEMQSCSSPSS